MPWRRRWVIRLAVLAAVGLLGGVAASHPDLRFVDFIGFAVRARFLPGGHDVVNPLYPVGYPLLLLIGKTLLTDVLIAGKVLSVLAGGLAVWATSRWLSPWAGLWLLCSAAMLQWGTTEGTDMLAAALCISGLLAVREKPSLAGALLGAACLTRYTAVAALPVALLLGKARLRTLLWFAICTVPHWGSALWLSASILPDQSGNLAIGGQREPFLSMHTLHRMPHGLGRAVITVAADPAVKVGAVGLLVGLLRRDWRAAALAGLAVLHMAGVGLAFVNDRLVLTSSLCVLLGGYWLIPGRLLVPAAAVLLWLNLTPARTLTGAESALAKITAKCHDLEGPILSTSPWFYQRQDGWLESGILLRRLGDSRHLDPQTLHSRALAWEVRYVAFDLGRIGSYPALAALARGRVSIEGFTEVAKSPGWRVYRLEEP